jgi:predicted ester cyclase
MKGLIVLLSGGIAAAAVGVALYSTAGASGGGHCAPAQVRRNEATVRIVYDEILSKGRIAENEHIYHPDFRVRGMTRDATREEDRAAAEGWRKVAPDLKMTVLQVVADCDYAAVHWEGTGTNTGEGNGLPATGRSIRMRGMTFSRLVNGQIIEEWTSFDQYTMLKQLGLLRE